MIGPSVKLPAVVGGEAPMQFLPDSLVGPFGDVLVRRALQIEPVICGERMLSKREAAIVMGVDEFLRRRRDFRQNAEPGERIDAFE